MNDIMHTWSTDLASDSRGDLALVTGDAATTQRVYRRLMTNGGDYLWNLNYGAGLSQFVGHTLDISSTEAIIRNQLELEPAVAATPLPTVTTIKAKPENVSLSLLITYTDASNGVTSELTI